ncbi:M20/M25/M40 family metallo-hydrolase [Candidatus Dojkabacteria bacterium]|uniref:M20/M25/M40 family metallo-hydrolase n=1 Tax=Candidatus Dojkabacteria bacterium TaxID=2099670 RepID=A0A955L4R1_9BACT|nr:M20/M25/M40 family metallo-hydrolase [Candidatus Dojkabacteria bacterium]
MLAEDFKILLEEFISLKSISTNSKYHDEMEKTFTWLKSNFEKNGFKTKEIKAPNSNSVIFAEYKVSDDAETILIYGHYDVQPAEMKDGWSSEPFSLTEKEGRLIARGVVDNKGQIFIHMYTIFKLIKEKKLKYNIKFLIEGNEETANPDMEKIVSENTELLKSDYLVISDGEMIGDNPTISAGLRGGTNIKITYKTANTNVHSGIFGSAIPSAALELIKLIDNMFDNAHIFKPDWFYKDVDEILPEQLEYHAKIAPMAEKSLEDIGVKQMLTEPGLDFFSQTGLRPTVTVTGFKTGYIEEGFSNIIPAMAEAKVNFRFVTSQNAEEIIKNFIDYVEENTPEYVECTIDITESSDPVKVDTNSEMFKKVRKLIVKTYEQEPIVRYVGGSIPFVSYAKTYLGQDALLIDLANEDCNMHGIDENFKIDLIEKGLGLSYELFSK